MKNNKGSRFIHGHSAGNQTKEYRAWSRMKKRCTNKRYEYYHRYGGRGIKVCDSWKNNFQNFLNDMGCAPSEKHSIDRIDNNGDYSKQNCRWATSLEQSLNRKSNKYYNVFGVNMTSSQIADILSFKRPSVCEFLKNKNNPEILFSLRLKSMKNPTKLINSRL